MVREMPPMREKIVQFLRIALLVMSVMAIGGPAALGAGMMLISMIFCDSGPFQQCAKAGAMFLGCYWLCAALPIPVVIALIRNKSRPGWYMYMFPFLMLTLACVVHAKVIVALGIARIAYEYGCLALVAFTYLMLWRTDARPGLTTD